MPRCPECSEELRGDEVVCPNCLARLSPEEMIGGPAPAVTSSLTAPASTPAPALVMSPVPPEREPKPTQAGGYSRSSPTPHPHQRVGEDRSAAGGRRRVVRALTLFTAGMALLLIGVLIGQIGALQRPAAPAAVPLDEGMALYQQGRYEAAAYAFGRAADAGMQRRDATAGAALAMMGWSAYRAGDYAGAGDLFAAAAGMDADRADTHAGLGLASLATGDLGGAEAAFTEALELDADLPAAHRGLGQLYMKLERPELALAELERAVALDPTDAEAHGALGMALGAAGRRVDAIRELEVATAGAPATPWIDALLDNYWAVGQYEDALRVVEAQLEAAPEGARWQYTYGLALWKASRLGPAYEAFSKVLLSDPPVSLAGDASRMAGVVLSQQEKYEEALIPLTKAIALQPDDAEAFAERGWALARIGRCAEGVSDFVRAKTIDPTLGSAVEGERACRQWLGQS